MDAAKADNRVAARLLLRWGADIDATDADGRSALLDASQRAMKRLLLDAGADPDRGRTGGMTLLAFFASFRERSMVDLLLAYGADPEQMTHKGPSVREILEDPATAWAKPFPMDSPEHRERNAAAILKLSDGLRTSPEAFVAAHRHTLIWSFGSYPYDDPEIAAWASQVSRLFASPDEREAAYRLHLRGDELSDALRSLDRERRRAERDRRREERAAEFEATYFAEKSDL
jgi:hypothetical protein